MTKSRIVIVSLGLLFLLALAYIKSASYLSTEPDKLDFGKFYASAHLYWQDKSIYSRWDYKLLGEGIHYHYTTHYASNLNAPFFTVLMLPLGLLKYKAALYLWLTISILAGSAGAVLLAKVLADKRWLTAECKLPLYILANLLFFSYFPSFINIQYGQVGLLLFFAVTLLWMFAREQRDIGAGLILGILISVKIFAGLIAVFFLFQKRWRALTACALTMLLCNLISIALFGLKAYSEYIDILHHIKWYSATWNASILGMATRLFGYHEYNISLWALPWLTPIIHKVGSAILLLGLWFIAKPERQNFDIGFGYTLVAMLLISPLGWLYYFPLLFIVFICLVKDYQKQEAPAAMWIAAYAALFLSNIPIALFAREDVQGMLVIWVWGGIYFYALTILAGTLLQQAVSKAEKMSHHHLFTVKDLWMLIIFAFAASYLSIILFAVNHSR